MSKYRERHKWHKAQPTSRLLAQVWYLADLGRVRVVRPTTALGKQIDEVWTADRPETDLQSWDWERLCCATEERFALLDLAENPLFIWTGRSQGPMALPQGLAYRLDYLEVNPVLRSTRTAAFGLTLIASRALECGATSVVLGSFPDTVGFYETFGAQAGVVPNWKPPAKTTPVCFNIDALHELKEVGDGFREEA